MFCSNGVNGVEDEGTCCESQCGTCGGFGCRSRPGGPVRWCMLSFFLDKWSLFLDGCYERSSIFVLQSTCESQGLVTRLTTLYRSSTVLGFRIRVIRGRSIQNRRNLNNTRLSFLYFPVNANHRLKRQSYQCRICYPPAKITRNYDLKSASPNVMV